MPGGTRLEVDITHTGVTTPVLVIPQLQPNTDLGQLRIVICRTLSSDYTWTAWELRAAHYPKDMSGITLDQFGRPTSTFSPFTVGDERVFYRSGNQNPGAASSTTAFLTDIIAAANRRVVSGPFCLGVAFTRSAGTGAVIRVSMEFGDQALG